MPLRGDFKTISLPGILQLLCLEQKTGVLQVTNFEAEVKVFFENGVIIYAIKSEEDDDDDSLGNLLRSDGIISADELRECQKMAREKEKTLSKVLMKKGYVPPERLKEFSRRRVEQILCDLFLWKKGYFEYSDGIFKLEREAVTQLNTMGLILEASRRADEMPVPEKSTTSAELIFEEKKIVEVDSVDNNKVKSGRRRHQRYEIPSAVTCQFSIEGLGEERIFKGFVHDISLGGLCVEIKDDAILFKDLSPDTSIEIALEVDIPDGIHKMNVSGSIRWQRKVKKKNRDLLHLGVQFDKLKENNKDILMKYLVSGAGDKQLIWDLWENLLIDPKLV
jgi:hypothetical protein